MRANLASLKVLSCLALREISQVLGSRKTLNLRNLDGMKTFKTGETTSSIICQTVVTWETSLRKATTTTRLAWIKRVPCQLLITVRFWQEGRASAEFSTRQGTPRPNIVALRKSSLARRLPHQPYQRIPTTIVQNTTQPSSVFCKSNSRVLILAFWNRKASQKPNTSFFWLFTKTTNSSKSR